MGTADFVAQVGIGQTGRPRNGAAADRLWRPLSSSDPIEAQNLTCAAIDTLLADNQPSTRQFEALLALDRDAEPLSHQLLNLYVEGDARISPFERSFWIAGLRLSQSFFQAYERFLRHARN